MDPVPLYALLCQHGINPDAQPTTLMRHKDQRYPLFKYIGTRALTLYQAMQEHRHAPGGLFVAFYGHKPDHALLLGVWRVSSVMNAGAAHRAGLLAGSFEPFDDNAPGYYHELENTGLLADLVMRLEVQWGGRPNSWRRILRKPGKGNHDYPTWIRNEPAVPFLGITNASLVMAQLRVALQDIEWQRGLGQHCGIYVITDERSGRHYVGSASGGTGILQRWRDYAATEHGGNLELVQLLQDGPGRASDFRFTVLEVLPLDTPRARVIERENYWKTALGTRTFGLNQA